jgi:hypothetical protein
MGVGAAIVGCGTTRLDAGSNEGRDAGPVQGQVWSGTPSNSFDLPCDLPAPDWLAGSWQGHFDAYSLKSGSMNVHIDVRGSYRTKGGLCGTVVLGVGDPLPLPTDARAAPPGAPSVSRAAALALDPLREGFPYEFYVSGSTYVSELDASFVSDPPAIEGQRIRFTINPGQPYKAWCNLQPSYLWPDSQTTRNFFPGLIAPVYSCLPPRGAYVSSDDPACEGIPGVGPASCAQWAFCIQGLCACFGPSQMSYPSELDVQSNGCTAAPTLEPTRFDLTVTDTAMVGSVVFPNRVEGVTLTRVP